MLVQQHAEDNLGPWQAGASVVVVAINDQGCHTIDNNNRRKYNSLRHCNSGHWTQPHDAGLFGLRHLYIGHRMVTIVWGSETEVPLCGFKKHPL